MSPLVRMSIHSPRSRYRPTKWSTTLVCFTRGRPASCAVSAPDALRQHAASQPNSCEASCLQIERCDSITHVAVTLHTSRMLKSSCRKGVAAIHKSWARACRGSELGTCMRSRYGHFRMALSATLLPPSILLREPSRTMTVNIPLPDTRGLTDCYAHHFLVSLSLQEFLRQSP